jgi:hypothetical protein
VVDLKAFAHFDELENGPNPGLSIKGFGFIGFPLADHDIRSIIAASGQERLKYQTVWEVSGDLLDLRNPA